MYSLSIYEAGPVAIPAVDWLKSQKQFQSKNIILIGDSMGALATIDYAAKHEVAKLVLISPVIDIGVTKNVVLRIRHFLFPSIYAYGASVVERVVFGVRPINAEKELQTITTPVLVLHTTGDALSPIEPIYKLQNEVADRHQTNITFEIIPGLHHNFIDQDPDRNYLYSQRIARFILGYPSSTFPD